ncbi:putative holliday junction resolvase [Oxobacter pfennigii]|uniref:Putative pre-16S rRNA nuclease n=1 Tax=Oxobacter pfennigii TaxID=36849 RepID=A0A0P9AHK3_9CLOT|nr:Holliday junction resolvase RuvX [Oxobacter pfennigii]KPU44951.1 putative holliday junction resolvase [Oxobacter pfennigii]
MRIMGLDIGDKRIGVAISDPLGWTAQGIKTIIRESHNNKDVDEIKKLIIDYQVDKIVIGLPKNMNNTLGPQSEKVMEYGKILEEVTGKEIVYIDERMTTMSAHRTLIEADVSRKKRKGVVDKIAAVYILQLYLDSGGK